MSHILLHCACKSALLAIAYFMMATCQVVVLGPGDPLVICISWNSNSFCTCTTYYSHGG